MPLILPLVPSQVISLRQACPTGYCTWRKEKREAPKGSQREQRDRVTERQVTHEPGILHLNFA